MTIVALLKNTCWLAGGLAVSGVVSIAWTAMFISIPRVPELPRRTWESPLLHYSRYAPSAGWALEGCAEGRDVLPPFFAVTFSIEKPGGGYFFLGYGIPALRYTGYVPRVAGQKDRPIADWPSSKIVRYPFVCPSRSKEDSHEPQG